VGFLAVFAADHIGPAVHAEGYLGHGSASPSGVEQGLDLGNRIPEGPGSVRPRSRQGAFSLAAALELCCQTVPGGIEELAGACGGPLRQLLLKQGEGAVQAARRLFDTQPERFTPEALRARADALDAQADVLRSEPGVR
jgi:hypothetical protein